MFTNGARLSLLGGVVFVIFWLIATVMIGQNEYLPQSGQVVEYFRTNTARISYAGYLGVVSSSFLLWFSGSLRNALSRPENGRSYLADIAFSGGVASGLLGMVAFSSVRALAERAETPGGPGIDAAAALIDLFGQLTGLALPVAFAVFIGATGLALLRSGYLPVWFGRASVGLGVALVSPLIYVVMPLGLLWTAVISLWLFFSPGQVAPARSTQ